LKLDGVQFRKTEEHERLETITLIACELQVGECNYIVRLALDIDKPLAIVALTFSDGNV